MRRDDGTATVQLGSHSWSLVAVGAGQLAGRNGHCRPPKELELRLEPTPELTVRWTGDDVVVLEADWLPPALHQRPIRAHGGRAEVPFVHGGELTAWAPDVPIWPHLAPSSLIGKDLPAMVLRGQLERSWGGAASSLRVPGASPSPPTAPSRSPGSTVVPRRSGRW
jgi:hypothetical protein